MMTTTILTITSAVKRVKVTKAKDHIMMARRVDTTKARRADITRARKVMVITKAIITQQRSVVIITPHPNQYRFGLNHLILI